MTPKTQTERIDAAIKWISELGHLRYCNAIRGPEGETWVEEEKCDEGCTTNKNTILHALRFQKAIVEIMNTSTVDSTELSKQTEQSCKS